jgi:hypothetical protein
MINLKEIAAAVIKAATDATEKEIDVPQQLQAIQNLQGTLAEIISGLSAMLSPQGLQLGSGLVSGKLFATEPLSMQIQATQTSATVTFGPPLPWGEALDISLLAFDINSIKIEQTQITFSITVFREPLPPIVIPVQS